MTDKVRTLTVTLDRDMRDDDAEELAGAIARFGGVAEVTLGKPLDWADHQARTAVRRELADAINEVFARKPER